LYPGLAEPDELAFLHGRSTDDWARLLGYTEACRFGAGESVVAAGELDRSLYIVVDGRLEVTAPGGVRLAVIERGSVFGEMAFLDPGPRSATVRAVEETELARLSFDSFEILAARYPELGRAILLDLGRIVSARLRRANEAAR
jgi:CRP/FNR family transcriptional regulator, cyclic AMP receptor protein